MTLHLATFVFLALKVCTVVALVGAVWVLWTVGRRMSWPERVGLIVLFAASLALREAAPASPHDIYMRSEAALGSDWPDFDRGMGFGAFGQVVRPWVAAWRADDGWLLERVALVAATVPVWMVLWLWVLEVTPVVVWTSGALFALSSPHVRLSHTDAQQIPALTFLWIGLCAWSLHARAPRWFPALVAACALSAAGCARLECAALPVAFVVVSLADRGLAGWKSAAGVLASALCLVVVGLHTYGLVFVSHWKPLDYLTSGTGSQWLGNVVQLGLHQLVILDPAYTSPLVVVWMVLGLGGAALSGRVRLALAVMALALSLEITAWSPAHGEAFALSRYQVVATPFAAILAANGVGALVAWWPSRSVTWITVALTLAASATRLPLALAPSTLSSEYRFVRDTLPTLPPGCVVLYEPMRGDKGMYFPDLLPKLLGLDLKPVAVVDWDGDTSGCVLYYRSASCSIVDPSGPVCSDFPDHQPLSPVVEADLPSRQWVYDVYPGPTVPVGFYRVGAPAP